MDRFGAGADPRGINPVPSFFGIGGRLPPPCSSSSSSSSLWGRRRVRDLREGEELLTLPPNQPPLPAPLPPPLSKR